MLPDLFTYKQVLQNNASNYFLTLKNVENLTNNSHGFQFETSETITINAKINNLIHQIVLFTDNNVNAFSRYKILQKLNNIYRLSYIPSLEILEDEFKVNDKISPVVVLDINDTISLNEYISNISFLPELIDKLKLDIIHLFNQMNNKQIAHGNLTFDSIRVTNKSQLILTALDEIYIPEFENSEITKSDYISTKNRDLVSKGLILSALEVIKTDTSITADNLIFNFSSNDLNNPKTSIAYTLLYNSGIPQAISLLNFEEAQDNHNSSKVEAPVYTENILSNSTTSKVQTVVISSKPNGVTVRNEDFDAIGRTPYTIEINEADNPYQIVLQEKDKLKKIDVYYGMDNVEIDINNIEKSNSPEEIKIISTESILGSQKEDNTQRNIFWGYVIGLFILMILITINNYNHFSYDEYDDLVEVESVVDSSAVFIDSAAAVIDSAAYYYDDNSYDDNYNYNSIDYYYDSVVDSTAVVVDSAVVSPYYYE